MKKTLLYSFLPCLMAMLMCTTFTACSDDDDDNGGSANASALIGTWVYEGADIDDGTERTIMEFKEDGTMLTKYYHKASDSNDFILDEQETGTYTLDNGKLIIKENTEDKIKLVYSITISGDIFSITGIGVYDENGKYYDLSNQKNETITAKRM